MFFQCPHCQHSISFFSRAVHGWRRRQTCPHGQQPIRQTLNFSRFFILAFMVGFPIKMLGVFFEELAFLRNVGATALIVFVLMLFCLRFDKATD